MAMSLRRDILAEHGLLMWMGFHFFSSMLRRTTPWQWGYELMRLKGWTWAWDESHQKTRPPAQDLRVLIGVAVTTLSLLGIQYGEHRSCVYWAAVFLGGLHLLGILVYHVNAMFFDDLTGRDARVWSYRRLFLQAMINLGETVFLFAAAYQVFAYATSFGNALAWSVQGGLTFNVPSQWQDKLGGTRATIWAGQVVMSLFFLVILLATLASQVFDRGQVSEPKHTEATEDGPTLIK